ncbi:WXG100 family type VII secretion target [Actinoalloteichus hymeniacidonis]|uniref:WXG100 family type VII secretion target n=1 Tax=Actinoalloteichus hymeniacidonis TaxID=340345 RepID=A0AAC9MW82_9PSEU|nr:hypothetical protein [Actinoalloteichus hymeniacidonis]AOS61918.1 hypothetical protein TL08_05455 [Actinoalloteichus hymeniacidonis]MBB5910062.1 hypothetical protein [Actinoalloteichus hymeniacidonis]
MADGFESDPGALRTRSPKFVEAADRLTAAFETLQTVRDAEHGCWGADETGKNFEPDYITASEEADKGRDYLVEGLTATKDGLDKTADQWESDDETNADNIKSAGGGL